MSVVTKNLRILHLARWYPNVYDPMPGLFIKRHAEAVAIYGESFLVYTHAVNDLKENLYKVEKETVQKVQTVRVYYNPSKWFLLKLYRFFKANRIGIRALDIRLKSIDIIHVHVLTRLALVALLLQWKYKIPYIITEHWTRYLKPKPFQNVFHQWITRFVVKKSAVVTTVSDDLSRAMILKGLKHPNYQTIRNVVAPFFYKEYNLPKKGKVKRLVHVSCFTDENKNISGLLRIISVLAKERTDFHISMVGDGDDLKRMQRYAKELKIPEQVCTFTGLLEGAALVKEMTHSDALIIFSNYENMPVVINESLVLGNPVFSTDVGGISELLNDTNGRLVQKGDETRMIELLNDFLDEKIQFNHKTISDYARNAFSLEKVGQELISIYDQVLDLS